jgi:O-acetylserine/cysteine efflux transporter
VVGIAASWIVQGETPDAVELIGGVVMLVGVAGAVVRARRPVGSPA